jgi:hypothetical protein
LQGGDKTITKNQRERLKMKIQMLRDICMAIYYLAWIPILVRVYIFINQLSKFFK